MNTEAKLAKASSVLSGVLVLGGLLLGLHVNPYWYALTAFMAGNLMQAPITGFCPLTWCLQRCSAHYRDSHARRIQARGTLAVDHQRHYCALPRRQ